MPVIGLVFVVLGIGFGESGYALLKTIPRCSSPCKLAIISATGFLVISGCPRPAWRDREKTVRFLGTAHA
jgi:hypothetical protein